jgi:arsenate reductase
VRAGRYAKESTAIAIQHWGPAAWMQLAVVVAVVADAAVAWSGGCEPGHQVNPAAVEAMSERGIDISHEYPKPWTDEIVRAADVAITMRCGDACPVFPGQRYEERYEEWILPDPAGQDVEAVRPIRDEIERRVRHLLTELEVPINA